ncbi:hypothetical protein DH2020_047893 [Rehmannia glutinosa]|uniref:RING-type E3 ubiquitin transferase n=1 Tax=Rehmannia glutinosa TaxID=99300 RepID=A0ABR0U7E7_REHGL
MSPHIHHDGNPTVVAVDRDKHSTSAVKWAIEHLLVNNTTLIMVHVRTRNLHNHGSNGGPPEANDEPIEDIFTQFRAYCARKRIVMQVVVLEGMDVHNTLLDYINSHHITNIVLGASSRSPITRKFWTHDVPTMINKAAPDFCNVYVVAKGKTQSVRPAARQAASSIPPRLPSPLRSPDDSCIYRWDRAFPAKGHTKTASSEMIKADITLTDGSMDHNHENFSRVSKVSSNDGHEIPNWWSKSSSCDSTELSSRDSRYSSSCNSNSSENDLTESVINLGSMDSTKVQNLDGAMRETVDHEGNSSSTADELYQQKQDETYRLEQARIAEEAALALIEVERAKCRAAIEAAEKAQKIAEKETQRRKQAELKAKRETKEKNRALDILSNNDVRYRKYTIEEIEKATNKFSRSMKIGEGGYGPVFKGKLDHTRVAIKVLRPDAAQGRKQFQQERDTFADLLDPTVPDWPVEEALGYAKLALQCAELRKKDRPDLAKVILPELNRLKELGMEHLLSHKNTSLRSSPR